MEKLKTLKEFLLTETDANELCIIRQTGYIIGTVYIDHEDISTLSLPKPFLNKNVLESDFDWFRTCSDDVHCKTWVRYIDVMESSEETK